MKKNFWWPKFWDRGSQRKKTPKEGLPGGQPPAGGNPRPEGGKPLFQPSMSTSAPKTGKGDTSLFPGGVFPGQKGPIWENLGVGGGPPAGHKTGPKANKMA